MVIMLIRILIKIIILALCPLILPSTSFAQVAPHLIPPTIRTVKSDLTGLERLRFLTTVDFRPFNYLDKNSQLAGYNVNLASAICNELKLTHICEIEAVSWDELSQKLKNGGGEAIIAGLVADQETRQDFLFSHIYFRLPARFITLKNNLDIKIDNKTLQSKTVGVIADSAHAYLLLRLYPEVKHKSYKTRNEAFGALEAMEIDLLFDDGVALGNWLTSTQAADCCGFVGEAFIAPNILSNTLSIAVANTQPNLLFAINDALTKLEQKGVLDELYLRYFPAGLY